MSRSPCDFPDTAPLVMASELPHFAKHAKRATVGVEDVKLLARKAPELAEVTPLFNYGLLFIFYFKFLNRSWSASRLHWERARARREIRKRDETLKGARRRHQGHALFFLNAQSHLTMTNAP